ncbi:MAG: LysM domain-containing protein [Pseudomonadota bacterium]
MFLDTSRYAQVAQDDTTDAQGRPVKALRLRRLPYVIGDPHAVTDHDRLDVLAQASHADGTRFWHIADANTALDARELVAVPGDTLTLPRT